MTKINHKNAWLLSQIALVESKFATTLARAGEGDYQVTSDLNEDLLDVFNEFQELKEMILPKDIAC